MYLTSSTTEKKKQTKPNQLRKKGTAGCHDYKEFFGKERKSSEVLALIRIRLIISGNCLSSFPVNSPFPCLLLLLQ